MRVLRGLPASEAGLVGAQAGPRGELRLGDIITHIDDEPIRSSDDYLAALEKHNIGDTVRLRTRRADRVLEFDITLSESR